MVFFSHFITAHCFMFRIWVLIEVSGKNYLNQSMEWCKQRKIILMTKKLNRHPHVVTQTMTELPSQTQEKRINYTSSVVDIFHLKYDMITLAGVTPILKCLGYSRLILSGPASYTECSPLTLKLSRFDRYMKRSPYLCNITHNIDFTWI